jgi:hypothetical protein
MLRKIANKTFIRPTSSRRRNPLSSLKGFVYLIIPQVVMWFRSPTASARVPTAVPALDNIPCFSSKKYALTPKSTCVILQNEGHKVSGIQTKEYVMLYKNIHTHCHAYPLMRVLPYDTPKFYESQECILVAGVPIFLGA